MTVILRAYEMGYEKLEPALIEKAKELSKKNVGGTILVLFNRAESTFWNKIFTGISDEIKAKELSKKNVGGTILVLFNRAESTFWRQ